MQSCIEQNYRDLGVNRGQTDDMHTKLAKFETERQTSMTELRYELRLLPLSFSMQCQVHEAHERLQQRVSKSFLTLCIHFRFLRNAAKIGLAKP